jgi:hypothetical protein
MFSFTSITAQATAPRRQGAVRTPVTTLVVRPPYANASNRAIAAKGDATTDKIKKMSPVVVVDLPPIEYYKMFY